ncbi:MAG: GYD family protein [Betaproteobacteria bacterium RIFCSPHIGHO2_12_FULL_69_13]|nr:MAG: GYD family protein [Betaproteobacteria bacterium RIFCSPHIGHO2_12_FULL_69_13]OGA67838.1 MAG: GYD family protein [Betaproteobacteria bacterium RIFCSPLOWO2_12_FULL_68_20]
MATYIVLGDFTDQGVRNVKETTKRADAIKAMSGKMGVTIKEIYWTLGKHDVVALLDAPDNETMTAWALSVGAAGNVRTHTLQAFNAAEMNRVLAKMG